MSYMERFSNWYHGNNDIERETPRGGPRRVGYILWNYTGRLTVSNLLFLLCCLPVLTIPAALAALSRYVGKIFRLGYGFSLGDYWQEYKGGILRYLPLGILIGIFLFGADYTIGFASAAAPGTGRDVLVGVGAALFILGTALGSWIFVLAGMVELPARHLLKNAGILFFAEWKASILAVVITAGYWGVLLAFSPWTFIWILPLGFSCYQLLICAALIPAVKRRVTDPYEQRLRAQGEV